MDKNLFSKFNYRAVTSTNKNYREAEVTFSYGGKTVRKYYFAPKDADPINYAKECVAHEIKSGELERYANKFVKGFKVGGGTSKVVPTVITLLSISTLALAGVFTYKMLNDAPGGGADEKYWSVVFRPTSENHKGHWEDNDKTETRIVKVKDNTLINEKEIPSAKPDAQMGGDFAHWSEEGKEEEVNLSVTKITADLVLEARYGGGQIDPETFEDHDDASESYFTMIYPRETADIVGYEESIYNDHIKDSRQLNPIPVDVDNPDAEKHDMVQVAKDMIEKHENLDLIFVDSEDMLMKFLDSGIPFRRFDDADGIKDLIKNDQLYDYQFDACSKTKGNEQHLYAMPIFASPTLFLYRRSVAKECLGFDDPTQVGKSIASMDDFISTSNNIKQRGKKTLLTRQDNFNFFKSTRTKPWLANGENDKLIFTKDIQNFIAQYLDFAKSRVNGGYDCDLNNWWYNEGADPDWMIKLTASGQDTFYTDYLGFPAPLWILNTIAGQDGGTPVPSHGDWALATSVSCGTDGGQYILVPQGSKNPKTALDFVYKLLNEDSGKYLTSEPAGTSIPFHTTLNKASLNKIVADYSSPFLGRQNPYTTIKDLLDKKAEHYYPCLYEQEIDGIIRNYAIQYANGDITKEVACESINLEVSKINNDERIVIEQ